MTDDVSPLVIVGAGGLGRETLAAVRAVNEVRPRWQVVGFVDDAAGLAGGDIDGVPVLGPIDALEARLGRGEPIEVVLCVGRPGATASRAHLAERLGAGGATFATVVHPDTSLACGTSVGAGSVLLAGVVTTTALTIGRHVVAMPHVVFTHDDRIDDLTTFATRATLGGGVHVGELAYLGAGSVIRENVLIGAGALVGMGAVVLEDVPPGEVWVGNPARRLQA